MAAPSLPLALTTTPAEKTLYTLMFRRRGDNPYPMAKNFLLDSSFTRQVVIDKCRRHCDAMGAVFIRVQPFLSDLAADERRAMGVEETD